MNDLAKGAPEALPPASADAASAATARRELILTTARRLWGQLGYHAVSLRTIADEAAVTLSLIDHHFGAKHALFAQAVLPLAADCERARDRLAQAPSAAGDALLVQLAAALIEPPWQAFQSAGGRDLLRLWMRHRHEALPEVRLPLDRAVEPLLGAVTGAWCEDRTHAERARVHATCQMVFCHGVELLVAGPLATAADTRADGSPQPGKQELLARTTIGLRVGLADWP